MRTKFGQTTKVANPRKWQQIRNWNIFEWGCTFLLFSKRSLFCRPSVTPSVVCLSVCLAQSSQGCGLPPYQVASRSIQLFSHNRHRPKIGGCAPLGEGMQCGLGGAYLCTKWHLDPSSPLATIDMGRRLYGCRQSLRPQILKVGGGCSAPSVQQQSPPDRQDRTGQTDNGPIGYSKPFYKQSPKNQNARLLLAVLNSNWTAIEHFYTLNAVRCP